MTNLLVVVLKLRFVIFVEAVTATVWPATIVTLSAAVGTIPPTQVVVFDQFPLAALVIVAALSTETENNKMNIKTYINFLLIFSGTVVFINI